MVSPGRWKLWHLAVAVLVVALMLGGLVALKKEARGSGVGGSLVVSSVVGVFAITSFSSAQTVKRLTREPLDRLKKWGIRRGGVAGFLAWLFSTFADPAILVGSIGLGLGAALGLGWLVLMG